MKLLIKKLLFRTLYPKPFFGVRIFNGQIEEKVFLQKNSLELDVSDRHNIVCESPFCIAIWVDKDDLREFDTGKLKLRIEIKKKAGTGKWSNFSTSDNKSKMLPVKSFASIHFD
jgi:hypothetical protein